jgi:S-adenosylmethionine:tRNA ribosyltransferase-isomerase
MSSSAFNFFLPAELNASVPPERRGIRRDHVRMMVIDRKTGSTNHTNFFQLIQFLNKGDLVVLNSSRTIPAQLKADWYRGNIMLGKQIVIRLACRKNESSWDVIVLEKGVKVGDKFLFSPVLNATVVGIRHPFFSLSFSLAGTPLYEQIYKIGEPIRYEYIQHPWGLDYYQTVFASFPGSVEMPSAGRAFSWEMIKRLSKKEIQVSFITHHTGLSFLTADSGYLAPEKNVEEYSISQACVDAIEKAKRSGNRVIAVGTTVVRALETVAHEQRGLQAKHGYTNLYIRSGFPLKVVDGLITGFHEPEASHLELLSALIEPQLLIKAYQEAIKERYLWHEFGDVNLIL